MAATGCIEKAFWIESEAWVTDGETVRLLSRGAWKWALEPSSVGTLKEATLMILFKSSAAAVLLLLSESPEKPSRGACWYSSSVSRRTMSVAPGRMPSLSSCC